MTDFLWTEQLTSDALKTLEHSTWAVINPEDALHAIDRIQLKSGGFTSDEFKMLADEFGGNKSENFKGALGQLKLIKYNEETETYELTRVKANPGFYSGQELANLIKDVGIPNPQLLTILGHNFLLHARESLPFCCFLMTPGVPKDYLKNELVDSYLFNQKLNSFKFDNLLRYLIQFNIIQKTESGCLVVKNAPPSLTFFKIAREYFFLASNTVGRLVNAGDLQREVDSLLPNREEDYTVLGFDKFPVEGWGRHQVWMTGESFGSMLHLGLIDPLCIARVLRQIAQDNENPSSELAKSSMNAMKDKILVDVRSFKGDPTNLQEVLNEFEIPKKSCLESDNLLFD